MSRLRRRLHPKTRRALAANPLFDICPYCNKRVDTSDWGEASGGKWFLFRGGPDGEWLPSGEPGNLRVLQAKHYFCVEHDDAWRNG